MSTKGGKKISSLLSIPRLIGQAKPKADLDGQEEFVASLTAAVEESGAASIDEAIAVWQELLEKDRGRPVLIQRWEFPPGTASGLWLDMEDKDVLVIEKNIEDDHAMVVLGHEMWHMKAGHCGMHTNGMAVAARHLGSDADVHSLVRNVAARTSIEQGDEDASELCGLRLAAKVQPVMDRIREMRRLSPLEQRVATGLFGSTGSF